MNKKEKRKSTKYKYKGAYEYKSNYIQYKSTK